MYFSYFKAYKDNISKFNKALEKSQADPVGMFHNEKLKELIFAGYEESVRVRHF